MSNNDLDNEDFDNGGFDGFDEDGQSSGTLGELIQSNPLVKIGVIFGAAALIFGTIILFGGKEEAQTISSVGGAPELSVAPGVEDATPAYLEAIQDVNQQNLEEAHRMGTSAIPIPIDPPQGRITSTEETAEEEDPLQRWRKLQEERFQREVERREVIEPSTIQEDNSRAEAINALAEAMSSQMQSILDRQGTYMVSQLQVSSPNLLENIAAKQKAELEAQQADELVAGEIADIVVVPAGEIAYAQIITEANSDVPGPVLAQIMSGPLSGSRILGSFSVQKELLTLTFNTVVVDGISYSIDAIALDPKTTLPGMATDVDHRYFQRIILPTAAAFIEGVAESVAETGRTSVSVSGDVVAEETEGTDLKEQIADGIEEAGSQLREILDEMNEDIEPLIIIASGTPMGLLFLTPMTRPATESDF